MDYELEENSLVYINYISKIFINKTSVTNIEFVVIYNVNNLKRK